MNYTDPWLLMAAYAEVPLGHLGQCIGHALAGVALGRARPPGPLAVLPPLAAVRAARAFHSVTQASVQAAHLRRSFQLGRSSLSAHRCGDASRGRRWRR